MPDLLCSVLSEGTRVSVGRSAGVLLAELVTCLIVVAKRTPELLQLLHICTTLHSLLDALDAFNRCAPGLLRDDVDDLSFPSLQGSVCCWLVSSTVHSHLATLV